MLEKLVGNVSERVTTHGVVTNRKINGVFVWKEGSGNRKYRFNWTFWHDRNKEEKIKQ